MFKFIEKILEFFGIKTPENKTNDKNDENKNKDKKTKDIIKDSVKNPVKNSISNTEKERAAIVRKKINKDFKNIKKELEEKNSKKKK